LDRRQRKKALAGAENAHAVFDRTRSYRQLPTEVSNRPMIGLLKGFSWPTKADNRDRPKRFLVAPRIDDAMGVSIILFSREL